MNFKPGQKVTYKNGQTVEKGIVKKVENGRIYVVYGLDDSRWKNYQHYTAAFTPEKFLTDGW